MNVYGLKTCDTCRRALADLRAAGHEPAFVDIRQSPLPEAEIARFFRALGGDLVNRRSTTWRGLTPSERAGDPVALLSAHPALMKRPVIDAGGALHLGWGAETRAALLGAAGPNA